MQELIKVTENEQGKKITSAKELYLGLGLNKSNWSRWYPTNIENNEFFKENIDWVGVRHYDEGNETKDFAITLEFAKHLAMMSKSKKSHEYRNYFIACENKLKEIIQPKLPSTYKEALVKLLETIEENEQLGLENSELKEENKLKDLENRLLSGEVFSWADTNLINAIIRSYGASIGNFGQAWTDWKKEILYKYGININLRITNFMNKNSVKTKPKTLKMLATNEVPQALASAISICKDNDVNISSIIKHKSEEIN